MVEPRTGPYLLCMLAGPRVIVLTTAHTVEEALRYAGGATVIDGRKEPAMRLWVEARGRPATGQVVGAK